MYRLESNIEVKMNKDHINQFKEKYGISDDVCKALDIMGYHEPMPVQEAVIGPIFKGQDLIVQSKTGSGKTGAFGIPLVEQFDVEENLPQALVLTPTRELAVQVCEEIADIGKYKKIRSLPIYGKQPIHIQLRQLKQRVHIVVGTPGRMLDLIRKKHLNLEGIKYLVIDEADELLKKGFIDDVEKIINKTPGNRTTLLFSATMPMEIENICQTYMEEPVRIEIESDEAPIEQINQVYFEVDTDWKFMRLKQLLQNKNPYSCMIFCNTRAKVDDLEAKLKRGHIHCAALHGKMAQKYRLRSINDFKSGKVGILVATDLAARGIHVDKLDLVVNFNVPIDCENYVHRIGRTGRAGEMGEAITFVSVHELKKWQEIQSFIGYKVPKGKLSVFGDETDLSAKKKPHHKTAVSLREKHKAKADESKRTNPSKGRVPKKHKDIGRIRINAGKSKKIRPGDILGAVSNLKGIKGDDIGIIDIQDTCSYIEIHNNKVDMVARELPKSKVKGRVVTVKKLKR